MRKLITLSVLSFALFTLSGCGVKETVTPPKYTGEPTQLTIEVQRASEPTQSQIIAEINTQNTTTYTAHIHLIRANASGTIIYQKRWNETVASDQNTIILPVDIPAEQNYRIYGYIRRGDTLHELGQVNKIDAPAGTVTMVTMPLSKPQCTLEKPDVMYSGGDVRQFKLIGRYLDETSQVIFGFNPWTKNGEEGLTETNIPWLRETYSTYYIGSRYLPEVTEPRKLYYQIDLIPPRNMLMGQNVTPHHYIPDLDTATELPYIWVYPYPGYKP